jgi:hypothetical protein
VSILKELFYYTKSLPSLLGLQIIPQLINQNVP